MSRADFYIFDADPPGKKLILREGLRLFAEKGLSATSIRDIAAATGLSNPALYKHFKTKDDLALILFERSYAELLNRLTASTRPQAEFAGKFRAFIVAFTGFYDEHPHAMMFTTDNLAVLWSKVSQELRERTVITHLRELLELGRSAGLVNRDEELDLQLTLVIGMLAQLTRQLFLHALDGPAARYADGINRILRAGLS